MHVTLHLTSGCNMNCDYCYAPPIERHDMAPQTAFKAIDLALAGASESPSIVFFGGEPLLRKDLIALCVAYGLEQGEKLQKRPRFKITTNGLALDDDFIRFCSDMGVVLAVSIDGCEQAHDAHRLTGDGERTYERVRRSCERLLALAPYSMAVTIVSPDTVGLLDRSVATVLDMGFRYSIVSLDYSAKWTDQALRELEASYAAVAEQYIARTRNEEKFYLSPFETRIATHIRPEAAAQDRCHLGVRQISVAPDGTIYPCVQFVRAGAESIFAMGHVDRGLDQRRQCGLHEMSCQQPSSCKSCALKNRCNHTCSCLNWQCTGDVSGVPSILCAHEKILLPLADKVATQLFREKNAMFLHKHYNAAFPLASLLEDLEDERGFAFDSPWE